MSLTWNGPQIVDAINGRSKSAVDRVAVTLLARAVRECPVDTGDLRGSGRIIRDPAQARSLVVFGDDTLNYAVPTHNGTARRAPNPFLARAAMFEEDDALKTFRSTIAGKG